MSAPALQQVISTQLPHPVEVVSRSGGTMVYRVRHNGRLYQATYEPKCKVCKSDHVNEVHQLAVQSVPVRRIHQMLSDGHDLSVSNVRSHLSKHFPDYRAYERALASASIALGGSIDPSRAEPKMWAQALIERGLHDMANGQIELKASDINAAAKFLQEVEERQSDAGEARYYAEAVSIILSEVRKSLTDEGFAQMMWRLNSQPRMVEIMGEIGRAISGAKAMEVESTEIDLDEPSPPAAPQADMAEILRSL